MGFFARNAADSGVGIVNFSSFRLVIDDNGGRDWFLRNQSSNRVKEGLRVVRLTGQDGIWVRSSRLATMSVQLRHWDWLMLRR